MDLLPFLEEVYEKLDEGMAAMW